MRGPTLGPGGRAATTSADPERLPTSAAHESSLPARLGMLLAEPRRALAAVETHATGVRDAGWLVLAGILCFRLEDLMRALLGFTHLSLGTVIRQTLAVVSYEVREAIFVVLPAALLLTLAAGRGRRDPGRDLELAAACYVPFFTVRAIYRTVDHEAFFGPLTFTANQLFSLAALGWACALLALAIAQARRRPLSTAGTSDDRSATAEPLVPAAASTFVPRPRARVAVTALAALLGAALFVNVGWVLRHADAIRPLGRGTEAPEFSLPRVDGKAGQVSLTSLRGKVVLLDFWATWCAPCMHMMPTLHRLYQRWAGQGVEFVGINADGATVTPDEVMEVLTTHPAPYPMVIDRDGEVGSLYKVVALPHIVLVGRDGAIVKTFWGVTSESEISQALASAASSR
jgi:thiol-disulfide isomerase/thioredoxin